MDGKLRQKGRRSSGAVGQRGSGNLAIELLRRCGMIRKSEKRRLVGAEAPRIRNSALSSSTAKDCARALSVAQLFRSSSNSYELFTTGERSVLPLLNLFEGARV